MEFSALAVIFIIIVFVYLVVKGIMKIGGSQE